MTNSTNQINLMAK